MNRGELFRTHRLLVRTWCSADEPKVLALYGMEDVTKWVDDGQPLSASEASQWMEVTNQNYQTRGYGMFAIDNLHSCKTIGFGGFVHPSGQRETEVKYAFYPEYWGQGYATEFVRGLLEYRRSAHRLEHIIATVAEGNLASKRVLAKSGFHYSATRTEDDGSCTEVFVATLCPSPDDP